MSDPRQLILERARAEGFELTGIAAPEVGARDRVRLSSLLANGEQGEMSWLAEKRDRREDPRVLWPDVRSVIVLGMNYGPGESPMPRLADPGLANISCYAWNRDYHDTVKKALKRIARWMAAEFGCRVKVFVDTAPVLEKPLAARSALGWQGKHTNLVSRELGSWFFLGEIFTDLDLPPDPPEDDHCGSCRACQDICPTNAFPTPYTLDPRRCISYLTIEHSGPIPLEFRTAMGNRIYGCDDCLAVCPWNKFATKTMTADFKPRAGIVDARLGDLLTLDDAAFRALFTKSPVKRIGRNRFLRNVLIACGNSGDRAFVPAIEALLSDPAPIVRGAAVWALSQLIELEALAALKPKSEPDQTVLLEWERI